LSDCEIECALMVISRITLKSSRSAPDAFLLKVTPAHELY
jgi:hypothetical protein